MQIPRPYLHVLSAICTNLFVVWLFAIFVTSNPFLLTANILAAIVSLLVAIKAEKLLDRYV